MTQTATTTDERAVPDSVKKAVMFMQAGAAVTVLQGIAGALTESSNLGVVFLGLIICAVEAGIWLWVASACQDGRNTARVWGTVFFAASTLGLTRVLAGSIHVNALLDVVDILSWLAGLGATVLLWQAASTRFFQAWKY